MPSRLSFSFLSQSPAQTRHLGAQLGKHLQVGDLICLQGELGAGKTTLVQGLAEGWGSPDVVTSPTFVLVNIYRRDGNESLFHLDAYRIESAREAAELDLVALLDEGPLVVEWAERIVATLPDHYLWVTLEHRNEEQREVRFAACGPRYESLLRALKAVRIGG